jgi:High potential iron-sulfur protein
LNPKENSMHTRRKFIQIVPVAGAALLAGREVLAQAKPADALDPKSAQATGLKYVEKSTEAGKNCSNCQLYQGGKDAWGGCPLFAGKKVAGAGWCSAWVKKA